jgi:GTP-binding protein
MAFIDELTFHIAAGKGGNGVERWRHEKGKEYSGAAGGNGGKGGDVYMRAVRDLGILARYRNTKSFDSQPGQDGMKNSMHGADGVDLIIDVPIGSVITDLRTVETGGPGVKKGEGRKITLLTEGETVRILKGGRGGLGNEYFKASTNVRPTETTDGKPGEEGDFKIDVELVADAGFIGLPNAGKSSLLNAFTNADAKVGAYQFTTLEPNLGAMRGYVLADIPGLIEGAAEGKGLGHRFLRHVKRTKRLYHLISLENAVVEKAAPVAKLAAKSKTKSKSKKGAVAKELAALKPPKITLKMSNLVSVYKTIRAELKQFGEGLAEKPETIILTKTDVLPGGSKTDAKSVKEVKTAITAAKKALSKFNKDILTVTILDDESVKKLGDEIVKKLRS